MPVAGGLGELGLPWRSQVLSQLPYLVSWPNFLPRRGRPIYIEMQRCSYLSGTNEQGKSGHILDLIMTLN